MYVSFHVKVIIIITWERASLSTYTYTPPPYKARKFPSVHGGQLRFVNILAKKEEVYTNSVKGRDFIPITRNDSSYARCKIVHS
jgi:hypothetical protein